MKDRIAKIVKRPPWVILIGAGAVAAACSGPPGADDRGSSAGETRPDHPSDSLAADDDAAALDSVVVERVVIFFEASPHDLDRLRASHSEQEFEIVADDLMYYRATALEYLENQPYRVIRAGERRPIRFLVAAAPRTFDFSAVELLDFMVAYEPGAEPRIIAPADAHEIAAYFRTQRRE